MTEAHPTREDILAFLDDLAEPVGPFVFAGFGGEIANIRSRADDILAADATVDAIKQRWVDANEPRVVLPLLVGVAPLAEDREAWTFELWDLLFRVGQRDRALYERLIAPHRGEDATGAVFAEVDTWFAELDSEAKDPP